MLLYVFDLDTLHETYFQIVEEKRFSLYDIGRVTAQAVTLMYAVDGYASRFPAELTTRRGRKIRRLRNWVKDLILRLESESTIRAKDSSFLSS